MLYFNVFLHFIWFFSSLYKILIAFHAIRLLCWYQYINKIVYIIFFFGFSIHSTNYCINFLRRSFSYLMHFIKYELLGCLVSSLWFYQNTKTTCILWILNQVNTYVFLLYSTFLIWHVLYEFTHKKYDIKKSFNN